MLLIQYYPHVVYLGKTVFMQFVTKVSIYLNFDQIQKPKSDEKGSTNIE